MRDLGAQQNRGGADRFPHHPWPPDHPRDELEPGVAFVGVGGGRRLVHHPARVTPKAAHGEVGVAAAPQTEGGGGGGECGGNVSEGERAGTASEVRGAKKGFQ